MKRILLFFAMAFSLVSCLNSNFSSVYNVTYTFEYTTNSVYEKEFSQDSIAVIADDGIGFSWLETSLTFGQKASSKQFLGGFVMSYLQGEEKGALAKDENSNDRFRVYAPSGCDKSRTYTVFYDNKIDSMMPSEDIAFTYKSIGTCVMSDCYVNNTTLVARKIKEHFQEGDKLVLKATGYLKNSPTGSSSIVLAEKTAAKDSIMYTWSRFDLVPLGSVDRIDFTIESTNENVPTYACIDNVKASFELVY